jgi:hypothetical protein
MLQSDKQKIKPLSDYLVEAAFKLIEEMPDGEEKTSALKNFEKEKKYRPMPNEKPPRREKGTPLSMTRDYGRDYMKEYRADGNDNNSYIPKGRKNG